MVKNNLPVKKTTMVISAAVSILLAAFCYLTFIQTPALAKREFAFAALLWLGLLPLIYLLLDRFLLPHLRKYSSRGIISWLLISALFGLIIVETTHQPYFYFLLPQTSLQIIVPQAQGSKADARSVTLRWLTTDLGDVSFSQLKKEGDWQITDSGLVHTGSSPASLTWQGRVGHSSRIDFQNALNTGKVDVIWDGQKISPDPNNNNPNLLIYPTSFELHPANHLFVQFLTWFVSAFLFLTITIFMVHGRIKKRSFIIQRKFTWLLYTLPMIVVWGISLLAFFPGIMSVDSINQWGQVISGRFNDLHPIFHTLFIWLITRFWFSPAAVVIFQILALSATIAWGISILDDEGLPPWASWGLAIIFALSPVNSNMVITIWKDILYSTSLLLFSLIVLRIIFTHGEYLKSRLSWFLLALVSLCVASFRHNGLPIPILTLPLLAFVYRPYWKALIGALALFLALWLGFRGPVITVLGAEKSSGLVDQIFVHHIAAHITTGESLTADEQIIANKIIPSDKWLYKCCSNVYTMASVGYSDSRNAILDGEIREFFFNLALKEPNIEINHQLCVNSVVWELPSRCGLYWNTPKSPVNWVDENPFFIIEDSHLKRILPTLSYLLIEMKSNPISVFLISPSLYLYLLLFITIFVSVKLKKKNLLLYLFPCAIQSISLLVVNVSSDFRYQYGVYLVGLFSLGLLILAVCTPEEGETNNHEASS